MRDLSELQYLYPGHRLLIEVEDRDIAIATMARKLAGATRRADRYKEKLDAIRAAVARKQEVGQ